MEMAQKVQVLLVDDVDGGEASETISFSLDGVSYEIDLSDQNAAQLRERLAPWVGSARRVGGRRQTTSTGKKRDDLDEIRQWARENGYTVSDRGRVAQDIVTAYDAAH